MPQRIVYCYSAWQDKFEPLKKNIEFVKGLPDTEELVSPFVRKLVIFNDMIEEAINNFNIQHLFTRGSHHHNMSIFLLTQNLFAKGKFARTINLNAQYTIIFDNPRDRTQIRYQAREIYPENSKFLIESRHHMYQFLPVLRCHRHSGYHLCQVSSNFKRELDCLYVAKQPHSTDNSFE